MKCVEHGESGAVKRISDEKAEKLVKSGQGWKYTNKQNWKEKGKKR